MNYKRVVKKNVKVRERGLLEGVSFVGLFVLGLFGILFLIGVGYGVDFYFNEEGVFLGLTGNVVDDIQEDEFVSEEAEEIEEVEEGGGIRGLVLGSGDGEGGFVEAEEADEGGGIRGLVLGSGDGELEVVEDVEDGNGDLDVLGEGNVSSFEEENNKACLN